MLDILLWGKLLATELNLNQTEGAAFQKQNSYVNLLETEHQKADIVRSSGCQESASKTKHVLLARVEGPLPMPAEWFHLAMHCTLRLGRHRSRQLVAVCPDRWCFQHMLGCTAKAPPGHSERPRSRGFLVCKDRWKYHLRVSSENWKPCSQTKSPNQRHPLWATAVEQEAERWAPCPKAEPKGPSPGSCQLMRPGWLTGIRDRLHLAMWFICCWRLSGHTPPLQTASAVSLPKLCLHNGSLLVNLHKAKGKPSPALTPSQFNSC